MTPALDLSQLDCAGFARELGDLRRELDASLGEEDLAHLRKLERWGRACTAFGLATAWIAPNPLSAVAFALGRNTRWVLMHHIAHRGYDRVPGVPARYTSKVFARGKRRLVDWLDWVKPEAWVYEHNVRHHSHTGETRDPDLIERNTEMLRAWPGPRALRYAGLGLLSVMWRPGFYGPNALRVWQERGTAREDAGGDYDWPTILRSVTDREFLATGALPYAAVHFVALPLLYAPLGPWAVWSALWNSLLGDLLTNIQSLAVVLPNHCGEDLYRYDDRPANRSEAAVRQVISSTNYATGGDLLGWVQLWLNYQIEHHLWPDLPMLKYKQAAPRVKELCARYGVPYVQESLWARIRKMSDVVVGTSAMRRMPERAVAEAA
ncbi:MAG: fatty acid desaturase [Deltaproteobacteria bacterium]|nr:fatty acid desaturase [Kofleriaceae bacterium]